MIDFKYSAGFVDADGSIQIHARKNKENDFSIYPVVSITQLPIRSNLLHDIANYFDLTVHRNSRGTDEIRVSGNKGRRFMEQIVKHLVIKQELARYILNLPRRVDENELKAIKKVIQNLRRNNTPSKSALSRKWAAGYIDGDGCIKASVTKRKQVACTLTVSSWIHAQAGIQLLKKTLGGYIGEYGNEARWTLSLSPSKVQELKELIGSHLRIKKTQLEIVNNFIGKNKHSRRRGATDEDLFNFCKTLATTKSLNLCKEDVIV